VSAFGPQMSAVYERLLKVREEAEVCSSGGQPRVLHRCCRFIKQPWTGPPANAFYWIRGELDWSAAWEGTTIIKEYSPADLRHDLLARILAEYPPISRLEEILGPEPEDDATEDLEAFLRSRAQWQQPYV